MNWEEWREILKAYLKGIGMMLLASMAFFVFMVLYILIAKLIEG